MTDRTYVSVDPGASGGIAWSNRKGVFAIPMPDTRRGVIETIHGILIDHEGNQPPVAFHEKINGFIPDGGPSMMFQFGANCERVSCVLETLGVRIVELAPQAWIKALGLGSKGLRKADKGATAAEKKAVKDFNAAAKREWKTKLKSEAERRFPTVKVTLKTSDALLILDAGIKLQSETLL